MPPLRALITVVLALAAGCSSPAPPSRPEPAPQGLAALPTTVRYVALGDSIAVGAGATTSYVAEFAAALEASLERKVAVTNLAHSGWTADDLLHALRNDAATRAAVSEADLVTWNIGGNDLLRVLAAIASGTCGQALACVPRTVDAVTAQWDRIVGEIVSLRRDDAVVLRTMDVYHPFVAEQRQLGLFETLAPYLDQVNAHLSAAAGRHGIRVAHVHAAFNGAEGTRDPESAGLLAADGVHPSDAGHALIADLLVDLG